MSQENPCAEVSFLIKIFKKRLQHRCFPVKFTKFLITTFLQNTSGGCFRITIYLRRIFLSRANHNTMEDLKVFIAVLSSKHRKLFATEKFP